MNSIKYKIFFIVISFFIYFLASFHRGHKNKSINVIIVLISLIISGKHLKQKVHLNHWTGKTSNSFWKIPLITVQSIHSNWCNAPLWNLKLFFQCAISFIILLSDLIFNSSILLFSNVEFHLCKLICLFKLFNLAW